MARRVLSPGWYFSKREIEENSPSRHDGMDAHTETIQRRTYCYFQLRLGLRLGLTDKAIATVYCHRFYLHRPIVRNDIRLTGTACMLLARRIAHNFREIDDVVSASYEIAQENETTILDADQPRVAMDGEKNCVMTGEALVLLAMDYDLDVDLPYAAIMWRLRNFVIKIEMLNFVNDVDDDAFLAIQGESDCGSSHIHGSVTSLVLDMRES